MRALAGATVRLVPSAAPGDARVGLTGEDGRFVFDSVGAGKWYVTVLHVVLDSLLLPPPIAVIDVREEGVIQFRVGTPSALTLVRRVCGKIGETHGAVLGIVRYAHDESAAANASVAIEWAEWILETNKLPIRERQRQVMVVADSTGRYAACGIPAAGAGHMIAWRGSDSSGVLSTRLAESLLSVRHVAIGRAGSDPVPAAMRDSTWRMDASVRDSSAVRGVVLDTARQPVAGARVKVSGSNVSAVTADNGSFNFLERAEGSHTLEVRALGFQPLEVEIQLRRDRESTLALTLERLGVSLERLVVEAPANAESTLAEFERRRRSGVQGTFLRRDDVLRRAPIFLSDAIRGIGGVSVAPVGGRGQQVLMRDFQGKLCVATVFLDGIPVAGGDDGGSLLLDELVEREEVAGVEVYSRGAVLPPEFQNASGCGIVAVWRLRNPSARRSTR